MGDELKSAFELAMERLRAKAGELPHEQLSDEQRARIGEIRNRFRARRAELEVLHQSAMDKARAGDDPQRLLTLEEEVQRDLRRIAAEEDEEVRAVRGA